MKTRVQKWGNSLAVRIPKSFALESNMKENSEVDLAMRNGQIVMRVHSDKPKYTLEELLEGVNEENTHPATDWGEPVGRELL